MKIRKSIKFFSLKEFQEILLKKKWNKDLANKYNKVLKLKIINIGAKVFGELLLKRSPFSTRI